MIMILTGRTGSNKHAIQEALIKNHKYAPVKRMTTRERRADEDETVYQFMSHEEFHRYVMNDEFAEWGVHDKKCYGTLAASLRTKKAQIMVLDPEGAEDIKKLFPSTYIIYVETDMKTAVLHTIERERDLTPASLQKISLQASMEEYLYSIPSCDYVCHNRNGAKLEDIAAELAEAHADWIGRQELMNRL